MEPKKPETVELPSIAEHQRSARVTLGRRPYGSFNDPMCSAVVEIPSAGETVTISTGDLTPPEKGAATADYALNELEKTLLIALADVRCLRGELKIAAYQSLADTTLDTFIKQTQAALPPVSTGGCSGVDTFDPVMKNDGQGWRQLEVAIKQAESEERAECTLTACTGREVRGHDEDPRCQTCGQPRSAGIHKTAYSSNPETHAFAH